MFFLIGQLGFFMGEGYERKVKDHFHQTRMCRGAPLNTCKVSAEQLNFNSFLLKTKAILMAKLFAKPYFKERRPEFILILKTREKSKSAK